MMPTPSTPARTELMAYAQRSPSIRRLIMRIAIASFAIPALLYSMGLSLTAYRTGFAPADEVYRTGVVSVSSCQRDPVQLGLVFNCTATVKQWNDDVQDGLVLTDSTTVRVVSRTDLSGDVVVASRRGSTGERYPGGRYLSTPMEVIMPLDQQPWPGWLSVTVGFAVLPISFGCIFLVRTLSMNWVLGKAAEEMAKESTQTT